MTAGMKTTITPRGRAAPRLASELFGFCAMLVAALLAGVVLLFATEAGAQTTTSDSLLGKTIVIDPGHGGSDHGATYTFSDGARLLEKDQNLSVAYELKGLLEGRSARVFMTRGGDPDNKTGGPTVRDSDDNFYADDANPSNTQRAEAANSVKGADVLVSIHMNGSTDSKVDYTTTLFGKWQKDKAFAYAVFGESVTPPVYGLRTLKAANGTGNNIATRAPYSYASGVLLKSNMPATIAETVFITNTGEAELLAKGTGERQREIARALLSGITEYLPAATSSPTDGGGGEEDGGGHPKGGAPGKKK